mmetsp:Transcript_112246/g.206014  ORF Transcript_112246/g.206014 Transcript_112246/m.206014 type:complete len:705 (+) Transcript_112246:91-2205(+)
MKACILVAASLLVLLPAPVAGISALRDSGNLAVDSVLTFDEAGAKERPVSKVIDLLKDMLKQLEKEAEEDEEIYDKMACWCETNDKGKTQAITDAESRISMLTTKVEELTASSARLGTEIKNLEKEKAANQDALDKATSIREKELAEFNDEEKDLLESISALKAAITVLGQHHSLLQVPRSHLMGMVASVQMQMQKHSDLLQGVLTHAQRRALSAFVQAPQDYFDADPTFKQSYVPQSGQIFGILKQMKETFESNLSASQKEEMASQKAYEDLKAAKEAEIAAGSNSIDKKSAEKATTDQKNAQAKEDIEDTKNSLSADEQFLMMLKEKCTMTDAEWETRQKTRQLEMEAVSKALAVLSSDDAHDVFTKTFNPALLQREGSANSERRATASKLLLAVSKKLHNPRLATLAEKVKLDAFTRVKEIIDKMVVQLLKEKEDEIKHKDFCVAELNQNQLDTEKKEHEKGTLIATIEDLEATIKSLAEAIAALKAEVAEMQVQLKRAGEDREKENKEFQMTIADQRETQKLLSKALDFLKGFYDKKAAAALVQHKKQEPAGPPPPPGFETYEKSAASGGVMSMIQQIISDAKAMEAETIRSEEDAQKAYEDFVKETNASIEAKTKDIVDKSKTKAQKEKDLVTAKSDKEDVLLELDQLANSKAELNKSCDFVMKNFEIRQTARDEEIEALKQAKAILSGAKFEAFLQDA